VSGYKLLGCDKLWNRAIFPVPGDELQVGRFKQLFQKALEQRIIPARSALESTQFLSREWQGRTIKLCPAWYAEMLCL
jgi:hypothetical protein